MQNVKSNGYVSVYPDMSQPMSLDTLRMIETIADQPVRLLVKESLKSFSNLTAVEKIKIEDGKKYTPSQIMKNFSYCIAPNSDRAKVKEMINGIADFKEYRLGLISNVTALSMLDRESTGKGLKFLVSHGKDIRPATVTPMFKYTLGAYFPMENVIYLSNVDNKNFANSVLLHEATHKIRDLFGNPDAKEIDLAESKVREYFKNNPLKEDDTAGRFIKEQIFDRVERARRMYPNQDMIREEMVADIARILVFAELNPEKKAHIMKIAAPLVEYFDKNMVPRMENYLLQSKNLNSMELSDVVKQGLRRAKNKERMLMSQSDVAKDRTKNVAIAKEKKGREIA